MNKSPLDRTRHAVRVVLTAALAALIAIGLLGAVAALLQGRGLPLEELAAAERACSGRSYVSEREQCMRDLAAATRANRVAKR